MLYWTILVLSVTFIVLVPVNIYLARILHKIHYLNEMKNKKKQRLKDLTSMELL